MERGRTFDAVAAAYDANRSGYAPRLFADLVALTQRRRYTAASFAAYLGTRSDRLLLPETRRADLLSRVEAELPAEVEADWATNLYVAPAA
jgi:hypothetical protein